MRERSWRLDSNILEIPRLGGNASPYAPSTTPALAIAQLAQEGAAFAHAIMCNRACRLFPEGLHSRPPGSRCQS